MPIHYYAWFACFLFLHTNLVSVLSSQFWGSDLLTCTIFKGGMYNQYTSLLFSNKKVILSPAREQHRHIVLEHGVRVGGYFILIIVIILGKGLFCSQVQKLLILS